LNKIKTYTGIPQPSSQWVAAWLDNYSYLFGFIAIRLNFYWKICRTAGSL